MSYSDLFLKCIEVLLGKGDLDFGLEGGYSNKMTDAGGETNFGISKKQYPDLNIKTLTKERAIEIYYNDYWIPMNVERLMDDELILRLFCFGVNAGQRTAIIILQKLIGVDADGIIGSETAMAVRHFEGNVIDEFIKREKLFYVTLVQKKPKERPNLDGWLNRIERTLFKT